MSIQEQRMKAYEEWEIRENGYRPEDFSRVNGEYRHSIFREGFARWNAALDSVVIELPNQLHAKPYVCYEGGWNDALLETSDLIEGMGLKVKP